MIISFLENMGLCHIVSPLFLLQTNLMKKDQIDPEDALCLFFPSLVALPKPPNYNVFCFGWFLECTDDYQLFSQRFFNSLTLHLTLKHAPEEEAGTVYYTRQCNYWRNGVKWCDENGVVTSVELVNDSRCVLILMSCDEGDEKSMISLRQIIIKDVLNICRKYCPTLKVEAFVIDPDCLKSYLIEKPRETTAYCVKNMMNRKKDSRVNPTYPITSKTKKGKCIYDILPHEPDYDNLSIFGEDQQYFSPKILQTNSDNRQNELSIDNLNLIVDTLKYNLFPDHDWKVIGHHLGLDNSTLHEIDEEHGTLPECFEKCLYTWLKREDSTKQTKSWKTLVEALDKMGQKSIAKSISTTYLTTTVPSHKSDHDNLGEAKQYCDTRTQTSGNNEYKVLNLVNILTKLVGSSIVAAKPIERVSKEVISSTDNREKEFKFTKKEKGHKTNQVKSVHNELHVKTTDPFTSGGDASNTIPKPPNIQEMKGIFSDVTDLIVNSNGLMHHCSQYGVTLIIPEGAVQEEETVTVHFGACLYSNKFKFGNYIPVTPIVWVYMNQELMKPAELHLPHHVDATNPFTRSKLTLLTSKDNSFNENELHFTKNDASVLEVDFALCKTSRNHFCSTCAAIEKSSFKDIQKRCRLAVAEKQESDGTYLFHCIIFPSQLACKKTIEEQYSQKDFVLEFSFKEMNFGNGGISLIFDPDNLEGWTRSHCGIHVDEILEDDVDYHKVKDEEDMSSKNVDKLKDLEKHCLYPPRFCYKFTCMDKKAANVIAVLQGCGINFKYNINLKQPGYDPSKDIFNILTHKEEDKASSQNLDLDSVLLGCLEVIPSTFKECQHHGKWFSFGLSLGLSPSELDFIESRYRTPVQYARAILLFWREKNKEASLEPLTAALEKVHLSEAATKLKQHFQVNPSSLAVHMVVVPEVAYRVMSECASAMKTCRIDLHFFAGKLLKKRIINEGQRNTAIDEYSGRTYDQRMDQLLDIIKDSVQQEGKVFQYILEILKDVNTILADKLHDNMLDRYKEYR